MGRGAAFGDVDNDGDIDVMVTNNGGPLRLLMNDAASRNHWVQFRLDGVRDNRQGLGARVGLRRSAGTTAWRRVRTDGSYLSASDPRVHFGLGKADEAEAVVVEWPRGPRETWPVGRVDRIITLKQGTGKRS